MLRHPAVPYVAPFAVFMGFLAIRQYLPVSDRADLTIRVVVLSAILILVSRPVLDFRVRNWLGTIGIGIGVFLVWIGPDVLIPGYRSHWLFQNSFLGTLKTSLSADALGDSVSLFLRSFRAILLVPVLEELFWRGWLMRWLINPAFEKVPLGAYSAQSFWIVAILFASEHGPYWDVGLLAGIAYNWWMIRTRSLGDCILAHAITNACLCGYVLATGKWEYWL